MHPRVERLPEPEPDYRRFLAVLRRERPDRIPLIELAVHPEVVTTLLAEPPVATGNPRADLRIANQRAVRVQHRLGYDVVKVSAPIPFGVRRLQGQDNSSVSRGVREWLDEHRGPIGSLDDVECYAWPTVRDVDFGPLEAATEILPDGMALIGFAGGVLEFSMDLLGMERLMTSTRREPALVAAVIERVGQIIYGVFETYCRMDSVCAIWLGDDLGHKHGPLLSPKWLTEHIVPWYRRFAELAHEHGRPLLLHTCGNTATVMPAIVDAGIDAKHSFEEAIEPVECFYDRWIERIAVLGGVDVHLLSAGTEAEIKQRTRAILEHVAPRGGYACGSGNSIPSYVSATNYLALIEAVAEFNAAAR